MLENPWEDISKALPSYKSSQNSLKHFQIGAFEKLEEKVEIQ